MRLPPICAAMSCEERSSLIDPMMAPLRSAIAARLLGDIGDPELMAISRAASQMLTALAPLAAVQHD